MNIFNLINMIRKRTAKALYPLGEMKNKEFNLELRNVKPDNAYQLGSGRVLWGKTQGILGLLASLQDDIPFGDSIVKSTRYSLAHRSFLLKELDASTIYVVIDRLKRTKSGACHIDYSFSLMVRADRPSKYWIVCQPGCKCLLDQAGIKLPAPEKDCDHLWHNVEITADNVVALRKRVSVDEHDALIQYGPMGNIGGVKYLVKGGLDRAREKLKELTRKADK